MTNQQLFNKAKRLDDYLESQYSYYAHNRLERDDHLARLELETIDAKVAFELASGLDFEEVCAEE